MTINLIRKVTLYIGFAGLFGVNAQAQVAGCTLDSFVNGGTENIINTTGKTYTPKCLRVKAGATVTIQASERHPLLAMADIDGAGNPFTSSTAFVSPQTREMSRPGIYGYFCESHGEVDGSGMAGAILVE